MQSDAEPSKRVKRRVKRSRTGCANCKKRRVRCDELLPFCANCERLNLICPGYPARHYLNGTSPNDKTNKLYLENAELRGPSTVSQAPGEQHRVFSENCGHRSDSSSISQFPTDYSKIWGSVAYKVGDNRALIHAPNRTPSSLDSLLDDSWLRAMSVSRLGITSPISNHVASKDPLFDSRLMLHFIGPFSKAVALSDRGGRVHSVYIPRLAMHHDHVLRAMLSVSAAHQAMFASGPLRQAAEESAALHGQLAISGLRMSLLKDSSPGDTDANLATCLLLAWKELIMGDLVASYQHAVGASSVVRAYGNQVVRHGYGRDMLTILLRLHLAGKQFTLQEQANIDDALLQMDQQIRQLSLSSVQKNTVVEMTDSQADDELELSVLRLMRLLNKLTLLDEKWPDSDQDPCKFRAEKFPEYDDLIARLLGWFGSKPAAFNRVEGPMMTKPLALKPFAEFNLPFDLLYYRTPLVAVTIAQYHRGIIACQTRGSAPWDQEPPFVKESMREIFRIGAGLLHLKLLGFLEPAAFSSDIGILAPMHRSSRLIESESIRSFVRFWFDNWHDEGVCRVNQLRLAIEVTWSRRDQGHLVQWLEIDDNDCISGDGTGGIHYDFTFLEIVRADSGYRSRLITGRTFDFKNFQLDKQKWYEEHAWSLYEPS